MQMIRWSALSVVAMMLAFVGCKKSEADAPRARKAPAPRVVTKRAVAKAPKVAKRRALPKKRKPTPQSFLRKPPKGFVALQTHIPGIKLQIGYHTKDNFTGAPLPGYGAPGAWMRKKAADALKRVHEALKPKGLGLLVYDAYRPKRGTLGMAAWARREGKLALFRKGYIAYRSGHNHGHTVDLTIVSLKTGKPLDMGTPWDTLDPRSNTRNAKGKALKNRLMLKKIMRKHGFRPYYKEWWHFGYRMRGTRPRDVPYGCFEAPEGKWKPVKGWDKAGYQMPLVWATRPCQ